MPSGYQQSTINNQLSAVTIRCAWIHYGYVARADQVPGNRSSTCAGASAAARELATKIFGADLFELHRQPGTRTVFTASPKPSTP